MKKFILLAVAALMLSAVLPVFAQAELEQSQTQTQNGVEIEEPANEANLEQEQTGVENEPQAEETNGLMAQEEGGLFQSWDTLGNANMEGETHGQATHLWLYSKDSTYWVPDLSSDAPWGRLVIFDNEKPQGNSAPVDEFTFNTAGLEGDTQYSLIYYPDHKKYFTLSFDCFNGCSGLYSHSLVVDTFDENGFVGHGYYNVDTGYKWNVNGKNIHNFKLTYTGKNSGYSVTCIDDVCSSNASQTFNLTVGLGTGEVWPHPVKIIASGWTNEFGTAYFDGEFDFDQIPWAIDTNDGAKIWLVLSEDLSGETLVGWNPANYLFENELLQ